MAKLSPKINLERLRAEGEKLRPVFARVRTELAGLDGASARFRNARSNLVGKKMKRSRRAKRERIAEVVRELWPHGVPARSAANPNRKLLRRLRPALAQRHIHVSDATLLRALGRRRDPKKKPMK
jgi:hypothetical protein